MVINKKRRKIEKFLLIFILGLLITSVSASIEILKPAKFNESYTILQTCASCNFVFITVSSVDGIIVSNKPMINNGSGVWTFNITPIIISRHDVNGLGDLDGTNTSFATFFEVSPSGKVVSTGDSILYALFSIILFGIIFTLSFFIFTMPSKNERDPEGGFETKIIRKKYFRMIFIALLWPLIILLLNLLNTLAINFTALSQFAGILGFFYDIMLRLAWPFTVIIIAWIIVMGIHDTNVNKQLKKITNFRI